jgi:hypothetical protein
MSVVVRISPNQSEKLTSSFLEKCCVGMAWLNEALGKALGIAGNLHEPIGLGGLLNRPAKGLAEKATAACSMGDVWSTVSPLLDLPAF